MPDGDLFRTVREGRVDIVTDTIDTFTEKGVRVGSGDELLADVVVTATGLNLKIMGGVDLVVDGEPVDLRDRMAYRALMFSGVPNFAFTIGYTNASWTLKADLVADYVCRLLGHLDAHGSGRRCRCPTPAVGEAPFMDFTPGYVRRSVHLLPKQGDREPWRLRQNYFHDVRSIRRCPDRRRGAALPLTATSRAPKCRRSRRADAGSRPGCPRLGAAARPVLPRAAGARPAVHHPRSVGDAAASELPARRPATPGW